MLLSRKLYPAWSPSAPTLISMFPVLVLLLPGLCLLSIKTLGVIDKYLTFDSHVCAVCKKSLFGRPFVKRFALCYRTVVCLSVTLVYCGHTVGWIRMPLGAKVGLVPGPRIHCVRLGLSSPKEAQPQFSTHVCCV